MGKMPGNMRWVMLALALLAGREASAAAALDLLGTRVELPFEYKVLNVRDGYRTNYGLMASKGYEIEATGSDGRARKFLLESVYFVPDRVEAGVVQNFAREEAEKAAAETDVREVLPLQVDGFGFHFIDGPNKSEKYPQRMTMLGVINGASWRLHVLATDADLLTPDLAKALKGVKLDYAALLRAKGDFDAEAKLAVREDQWIDTPIERLTVGRGENARLTQSQRITDAAGNPVFRRRTFNLFKAGFMTMQYLAVSVGCGVEDSVEDDAYADYLAMTEERKDEKEDKRYTMYAGPTPGVLAGLPAETASANGPRFNPMRHTKVNRWVARKDGDLYQVHIERLNGSPIERSLVKQLESATARCQSGLQFGNQSAATE